MIGEFIPTAESSGLRIDSIDLVFQIRAIDRSRIKEAIGAVSILELAEIRAELAKDEGWPGGRRTCVYHRETV